MKNKVLINLIKKVDSINWNDEKEVKFILDLNERYLSFIVSSDKSLQRDILEFFKSEEKFKNKDDFNFVKREIFMRGFDQYLIKPSVEGKFYISFLHNDKIINTKYYRDIVKSTIGNMTGFKKYSFSILILKLFDSNLVDSKDFDTILDKVLEFSNKEDYESVEFIDALLNNGKIGDYLDYCILLGLENSGNQYLTLLFTNLVLLNRDSFKDIVSFVINKNYLYDFINLINNRNIINERNGKVFYETEEFKGLNDDINEVKAYAKIYNSDLENSVYESFIKDLKLFKSEIKLYYTNLVLKNYKDEKTRKFVLSKAMNIKDAHLMVLYNRLVNNSYLINSPYFFYVVDKTMDLEDFSKINIMVSALDNNDSLLSKSDFKENFDIALSLCSKSSNIENFKKYMFILSYKLVNDSKCYKEIIEVLNYVADLLYVEPFYEFITINDIFKHKQFLYFVNNFKRLPENHFVYVNIVKTLVKNKIDIEKTKLTIETYIENPILDNYRSKFLVKVIALKNINNQDNYVSLLKAARKMNFEFIDLYSNILTNERVVNIENLDEFIDTLLKIKDEELLDSIYAGIKDNIKLDLLFKFKAENQFYLFSKLIINNKLFNSLKDEVKENIFNIINDGVVNPSYRLLYVLLSSDFNDNIKLSCLSWINKGVSTLDELKVKLGCLSKYEEFVEDILKNLHSSESNFEKVNYIKYLEELGLEKEVDKEEFVNKLRMNTKFKK